MPKILVLEDSPERVEWLRANVLFDNRGEVIDISWVTNYKDFCEVMGRGYDLMIFDHDLGEEKNGYNAAYEYAYALKVHAWDETQTCAAKALVWSFNPAGAEKISSVLRQVGVEVKVCPFEPRPGYAQLIIGAFDPVEE